MQQCEVCSAGSILVASCRPVLVSGTWNLGDLRCMRPASWNDRAKHELLVLAFLRVDLTWLRIFRLATILPSKDVSGTGALSIERHEKGRSRVQQTRQPNPPKTRSTEELSPFRQAKVVTASTGRSFTGRAGSRRNRHGDPRRCES